MNGYVFSDHLHLGLGVFTTKPLLKGDFIVEYSGNLVTSREGEQLEREYKEMDDELKDSSVGSFLYFFGKYW